MTPHAIRNLLLPFGYVTYAAPALQPTETNGVEVDFLGCFSCLKSCPPTIPVAPAEVLNVFPNSLDKALLAS